MKKRIVLIAAPAAVLVIAAVATGIVLLHKRSAPKPGATAASAAAGTPDTRDVSIPLEVSGGEAVPSAWVEVYDPPKLWKAVRQNAWVKKVMAQPLGEGFMGSWGAFLGTRGEDLEASFKGEVAALVVEKLLADPFRLVWYRGKESSGAPVLVVPSPSRTSRAAFEALDKAVRRGSLVAARCPGKQSEKGGEISIYRWLIAEHALFGGESGGRMAFSRQPRAVLQGLCAAPDPAQRPAGVDFELALTKQGFGVQSAALGDLAGLGQTLRLLFAVSKDTVVPVGITGDLKDPERLAAVAPPKTLLAAIPEDTGVVLTLALQLPQKLDVKTFEAVMGGEHQGPFATRQVTVAWTPHGDASEGDMALLWAAPAGQAKGDRQALAKIFSGEDAPEPRTICGQEVLASSKKLLESMERACAGTVPNLLDGAPEVKAGLQQASSISLGVNVGRVLSTLLDDAADAEKDGAGSRPEIESAKELLEELPFMGLRGVAKEKTLVPGGYRS